MKTIYPVALVASLSLLSCNVRLGGTDGTMVIQGAVTSGGAPVSGVALSAAGVQADAGVDGRYSITLPGPNTRAVVSFAAKGFAPMVTVVDQRAGVYHYQADVELTPLVTLSANGTTTLSAGGQAMFATVDPKSAPVGGRVEAAAAGAESGPGRMETTEGSDQRLQTGGMVYVRAVDASGNPAPMGAPVTFTTNPPPPEPDPSPPQTYVLQGDGVWGPVTTTATGSQLIAQREGWWNADRAYRIACVHGKIDAPTKACGGQQVKTGGGSGIYTYSTSQANGEFCIEGPQSHRAPITVGKSNVMVQYPVMKGNCGDPKSCVDIGLLGVKDSDCPFSCDKDEVDDPSGCKPAGGTGGGGGGAGGGSGGGNFTCGKPPGGCAAMGSGFTDAQLGNGCCVYTACSKGGQQGSCSNTCQGWYEGNGQLFGPCNAGDTACIMNAANQLNQACP